MKKTRLLNTYVNNITMDEAVDFLLQKIRKRDPAYVIEINVDVVVKMEHDPELRHISDDADLTLVDGQPLLWIARWYGRPLKMKVSGSDLVPALLKSAAREGRSVFVLGGREDVARKAAENIQTDYPNLVVAGELSPSMGFENDPEELAKIQAVLQTANRIFCWPVLAVQNRKNGSADIIGTVVLGSRSVQALQWIFLQAISNVLLRCLATMVLSGFTAFSRSRSGCFVGTL